MGYCKEKSFLSLQSSEVLTDKVNKYFAIGSFMSAVRNDSIYLKQGLIRNY